MFGTLFIKECKAIVKSTTYYLFLACLVLFFVGQMESNAGIAKPLKGQASYGYQYSKDPKVIMQYSIDNLLQEFESETYITYPFGFYKEVHPSKSKQSKIAVIISEVLDENYDINMSNSKQRWRRLMISLVEAAVIKQVGLSQMHIYQ